MKKLPQLLLLLIIGISDAYMVSHPNILGKIGVRVYNYSLIKNFPNALITILSCIIISLLINYLLQKQKGKKWAKYAFIILLIISLAVLFDIYWKFSAGSYAHTGKVFKFGMHLLPIIFIYIFGNGLWEWLKNERIK